MLLFHNLINGNIWKSKNMHKKCKKLEKINRFLCRMNEMVRFLEKITGEDARFLRKKTEREALWIIVKIEEIDCIKQVKNCNYYTENGKMSWMSLAKKILFFWEDTVKWY